MNHTKNTFLLVLILLFSFSTYCQSQKTFEVGKINNKVSFIHDNTRSYALYLPVHIIQNPERPIIYIYDPEGNGSNAINHFIETADKYGYILVAANMVLTQDSNLALEVTDMIIEDLNLRFNLKGERMYSVGLSEAAHIASSIAVITNVFSGVINCNGSTSKMPIFQNSIRNDFSYVNITRRNNSNYPEINNYVNLLNSLGITTKIINYNNDNSWPSSKLILKAFDWLEKEYKPNPKINSLDKLF